MCVLSSAKSAYHKGGIHRRGRGEEKKGESSEKKEGRGEEKKGESSEKKEGRGEEKKGESSEKKEGCGGMADRGRGFGRMGREYCTAEDVELWTGMASAFGVVPARVTSRMARILDSSLRSE